MASELREAIYQSNLPKQSTASNLPDTHLLCPPGWVAPGTQPPTDVPHPVSTFIEPIELGGEPGNGVPAGYIITRETAGGPDDFNVTAKRAEDLGFPVVEYIGNHVPYREDPEGVAGLLVGIGPVADRASK